MKFKYKQIKVDDIVYRKDIGVDDYQRSKNAWGLPKMIEMISNVIKYKNVIGLFHIDTRSKDVWYLIDAQQRFGALIGFMNNEFKVNGEFFSDLSNEKRKTFLNATIMTQQWYDCTQEEMRTLFEVINSAKALKQYEIRKARNGNFATDIVPYYVENLAIFKNSVPESHREIKYLVSSNHNGEFRNTFEKIVYVSDFQKGLFHNSVPNKKALMKQTVTKADSTIHDDLFLNIEKVTNYLEVGMNKFRQKYSRKTHGSTFMFTDAHLIVLFRVVWDLMYNSPYDLSGCEFPIIEQTLMIHEEAREEEKKTNGDRAMSEYAVGLSHSERLSSRQHTYHYLKESLEGVVSNVHNKKVELVGRKKP